MAARSPRIASGEEERPPPSGLHTAANGDQTADSGPAGPTASPQSSSQQAVKVAAVAIAFKQGQFGFLSARGLATTAVQSPAGCASLELPRAAAPVAVNAVCGQLECQTLPRGHTADRARAAAEPASRGAVADGPLQAATRGYQPSANALELALASPAARQGGMRDWLPQRPVIASGHRQRSAVIVIVIVSMQQRPHCRGHRQRSASSAHPCIAPALSFQQRHKLEHQDMGGVGWGPPPLPYPSPPPLVSDQPWLNQYSMLYT